MTDRPGDRDRLEGSVEEAKGNLKQAWGDLTGDDRTKAEGMMDEAKGKAEQFMGDVKNAMEDVKDDIERSTR